MDITDSLQERILILDGAMGTLIQAQGLGEQAYHQGRFADWGVSLTGNNDVLNITAPEVIAGIHRRYIEAGADIISTNTFSSNRISQKEYGCEHEAREMARAGARIARQVADSYGKIWVAGSMGPTSKSLSLASDMNKPGERLVNFDEMAAAYGEQAEALIEGGADLLLLETCYDALNAKAALYAIQQLNEQRCQRKRGENHCNFHFPLPQPHPLQLMGQLPHLPPQMGDFPFFLSFTILAIIAATITASTMHTIIVPIFAPIHESICVLLSYFVPNASFLFLTVSLVASL